MFLSKVITTLNAYQVSHVLIGGYAVALHGAVRGTVNIDIVVPLSKQMYVKADQALRGIGLEPRLPVTAEEIFDSREYYIRDKNLVAWSFYNSKNPLEMVDIIITADANTLNSITKTIDDLEINIVSIDALIKLKQSANRPQDIEDIKALRRLM